MACLFRAGQSVRGHRLVYRQASGSQRRELRALIRQWLGVDFGDENLLRQDWLTGGTLFLRSVAFRTLQADFPS